MAPMSDAARPRPSPAAEHAGDHPGAGRRITVPPSLTALATTALRDMILAGELRPGDRVIENQLTRELGVSRPPLREAMRVLEQEGLIVQVPRRGAVVTPLTAQDVYEIVTLREQLEDMAVRLGVPVRDPERLNRLRSALAALEQAAATGDTADLTQANYGFHLAFVGLAGHRRLEETYRSLSLQMLLCMSMNRRALADRESLTDNAARHRALVELVEAGDRDRLLAGLAAHGHRSFLPDTLGLDGGTDGGSGGEPAESAEAVAWLHSASGDGAAAT